MRLLRSTDCSLLLSLLRAASACRCRNCCHAELPVSPLPSSLLSLVLLPLAFSLPFGLPCFIPPPCAAVNSCGAPGKSLSIETALQACTVWSASFRIASSSCCCTSATCCRARGDCSNVTRESRTRRIFAAGLQKANWCLLPYTDYCRRLQFVSSLSLPFAPAAAAPSRLRLEPTTESGMFRQDRSASQHAYVPMHMLMAQTSVRACTQARRRTHNLGKGGADIPS